MSLLGTVLVAGCGADTSVPTGGDAVGDTPPGVASSEGAGGAEAQEEWQAVRMEGMDLDRSTPEAERRNPFRFGAPRGSVPQPEPDGGDTPADGRRPVPGRAPPDRVSTRPAPSQGGGGVPLTFIGFVETPGVEGRVVVLTDGDLVFYGRVGDVIDGRYRIVGLGLESVDIERIDGRGQQTLRLSNES